VTTTAIVVSLALVALVAGTNFYGFSAGPGKAKEGRPPLIWAGIYNVFAVVTLLELAVYRAAHYRGPEDIHWFGLGILLLGGALRIWGVRHLGKNFSYVVETDPKAALVTDGPYAYTRHPIYTAQIIMCVGLAVFSEFWASAILVVLLLPMLAALGTREDALLSKQFGPAFDEYRRVTRGLTLPAWARSAVGTP